MQVTESCGEEDMAESILNCEQSSTAKNQILSQRVSDQVMLIEILDSGSIG